MEQNSCKLHIITALDGPLQTRWLYAPQCKAKQLARFFLRRRSVIHLSLASLVVWMLRIHGKSLDLSRAVILNVTISTEAVVSALTTTVNINNLNCFLSESRTFWSTQRYRTRNYKGWFFFYLDVQVLDTNRLQCVVLITLLLVISDYFLGFSDA